MKVITKSSNFLKMRAQALKDALSFFSRGGHQEKAVFLAQLSFWTFEVDSLIDIFDTFPERSLAWGPKGLQRALQAEGISLKPSISSKLKKSMRRVDWVRADDGSMRALPQNRMRAPKKALKEVLDEWNSLLIECQKLTLENEHVWRLYAAK